MIERLIIEVLAGTLVVRLSLLFEKKIEIRR